MQVLKYMEYKLTVQVWDHYKMKESSVFIISEKYIPLGDGELQKIAIASAATAISRSYFI